MKKKLFSLLITFAMLLSIAPAVFAADETEAPVTAAAVEDEAYLMYADSSFTYQYWNDGTESDVVATKAVVTGAGEYTVGLDFTGTADGKAEGLAFAAVGIVNGETNFPGYCITIKSVTINGEAIPSYTQGYTSSDDGICTRQNMYNTWVTELPVDARTPSGDLTSANWLNVDPAIFVGVETVSVTFEYTLTGGPDTAYIMYADTAWTYQYWGSPVENGVVATDAIIDGAGNYTVGLDFTGTADGAASGLTFTALGIKTGELTRPGSFIQINSIKINGEDVAFTKGYTSSDNAIETRMNIMNEWVAELPADARSADGNLTDANWIIVDKELFASVQTIEINFDYILGDVVAATPTPAVPVIDVDTALASDYNAYFGVQTVSFTFRNAWYDSYGMDTANWSHLTGWDADGNEVDYGGIFTDAAIKGNGTYTVSLALGEMKFGTDESFNMLFVSTDIPSQLVIDGYVTFSDVKTVMDGGKEQAYTFVDVEQDYARITVLNSYNADVGIETIAYTMPTKSIDITFTISGLSKDAESAATPTAEPTATPVPDKESGKGLPTWAIAAIIGGAVVVVGGGAAAAVVLNKKKNTKAK